MYRLFRSEEILKARMSREVNVSAGYYLYPALACPTCNVGRGTVLLA